MQPSNGTARTTTVTYTYDDQNQLETERYSGARNDTISYTYDTAGNILSEAHGGITTRKYTYAYDDKITSNDALHDLLVEVDGHTISYDGSGNPLNYYNGYKTYTDLKWVQGRQLTSITTDGKETTYTYDVDGIRTTKVVDGVEHRYVTRGGKLMRESFGSGDTEVIMDFSYDESGRPFAVSYSKNGGTSFSTYYYATNLQGDVVMIFGRTAVKDADGNITGYNVKSYGYYTYDAWGHVTVSTAAGNNASVNSLIYRNPIRYRGYVYDSGTGFYYLQSRYYDPANHRFINADAPEYSTMSAYGLNNSNLFTYCQNNPVAYGDENGEWLNFLIGAVVGAVVNAVSTAVEVVKEDGWGALSEGKTWAKIGISATTGAINGAVAASGLGVFTQAGISAVTSFVSDCATQYIDTGHVDAGRAVKKGIKSGALSIAGSYGGKLIGKYATKTSVKADELFDKYLGKTFSAGLRQEAGRSSSALLKQADKIYSKVTYYDNITKGVSSVFGSSISLISDLLL